MKNHQVNLSLQAKGLEEHKALLQKQQRDELTQIMTSDKSQSEKANRINGIYRKFTAMIRDVDHNLYSTDTPASGNTPPRSGSHEGPAQERKGPSKNP